MFTPDPFDIAPAAPRHTRASWFVLAAGLVFAALCAWPLAESMRELQQAQKAGDAKRRALRDQAEKEATTRRKQQDPAFLEKIKAQQRLQQLLRMSWSGLFGALESAGQEVDGGATILSLIPAKTQADAAQVDIAALAVSTPVMLEYLRALEKNPSVREVQLSMQQPGAGAGVELVRFQFSILWDPHARARDQSPGRTQMVDAQRPGR